MAEVRALQSQLQGPREGKNLKVIARFPVGVGVSVLGDENSE